ncbi:exodeoxyribonuclease VII large subunit [Verrucomicrobia bacterium LW23]|nr:exodeoxyribonuclease VII large subunit [Verrucomicrobia bacterium LW23]
MFKPAPGIASIFTHPGPGAAEPAGVDTHDPYAFLPGGRRPVTVTELTRRIRQVLEGTLGEVWVAGEISNLSQPGSGHVYFTLKDPGATLSAVMFRTQAARVRFALRDGTAVAVRGTITVYEARGQYQITVQEMRPLGIGSLQQRFEELKQKLAKEGLFDRERKRPLPVFPERVGLITALQGAVVHDFVQILRRRAPGIVVQIRGVRVQGPGAAEEIVAAIRAFQKGPASERVHVLIVARGGGSLEDLWAFNEEIVARALAGCSIPTISAVGHETDFTIADFVADLRAPTPSAAAELLTRDWQEWRDKLRTLDARLRQTAQRRLEMLRLRVGRARDSYVFREPVRIVRQMQQRVDDLERAMQDALRQRFATARHTLEKLTLRFRAADLRHVLRRHRERLANAGLRLAAAGPRAALERYRQQLQALATRLRAQDPRSGRITRSRERIAALAARLRALSPAGTLSRGYALFLDSNGHIVREPDLAMVGSRGRVLFAEGSANVEVASVDSVPPFSEAAFLRKQAATPSQTPVPKV